jgi:RNA polymerase sigma-70 factor, ECF subfamily
MEEANLIAAALQGDLDAFNQLVLIYQDAVFTQAYYMLNDLTAAEDIAQEAFILAFKRLSQYRGGSFRAWLLRIVTNACYDEIRRWKRKRQLPLIPLNDDGDEIESPGWIADPGPSIEEMIEQSELADRLGSLLNELPASLKAAVVLVDLMEMDYADAASSLGVPMGTLKSRLARGRLKLRDLLVTSELLTLPHLPQWQEKTQKDQAVQSW